MRNFQYGCLVIGLTLVIEVAAGQSLPSLPDRFDHLGPTVQTLQHPEGRVIHFIDDGDPTGQAVVFTGGLGTSVRAIRLLDFLRSFRVSLGLRFIAVERNGFGQTAFDPTLTMINFAEDVERVLESLEIDRFSVFGISGGGPYTAQIAARNSARLLSVHMAATLPSLGGRNRCGANSPGAIYRPLLAFPMQYFGFPSDSAIHRVPGLQDTAYDEGARAHFLRGQMADPAPLDHELNLYCLTTPPDNDAVRAPVYVYAGLDDSLLASMSPAAWQEVYPNSEVTLRTYPGEGHDVQYRHLDQILLDLAGFGDRTLVCQSGQPRLLPNNTVSDLAEGDQLGLCAW